MQPFHFFCCCDQWLCFEMQMGCVGLIFCHLLPLQHHVSQAFTSSDFALHSFCQKTIQLLTFFRFLVKQNPLNKNTLTKIIAERKLPHLRSYSRLNDPTTNSISEFHWVTIEEIFAFARSMWSVFSKRVLFVVCFLCPQWW